MVYDSDILEYQSIFLVILLFSNKVFQHQILAVCSTDNFFPSANFSSLLSSSLFLSLQVYIVQNKSTSAITRGSQSALLENSPTTPSCVSTASSGTYSRYQGLSTTTKRQIWFRYYFGRDSESEGGELGRVASSLGEESSDSESVVFSVTESDVNVD